MATGGSILVSYSSQRLAILPHVCLQIGQLLCTLAQADTLLGEDVVVWRPAHGPMVLIDARQPAISSTPICTGT